MPQLGGRKLFRESQYLLLAGDQESAANYRAPVLAALCAIWGPAHTKNGTSTA